MNENDIKTSTLSGSSDEICVNSPINSPIIPKKTGNAFDFKLSRLNPSGNSGNPIELTKIQKIQLSQKLLKELKFVITLDDNILHRQQYYWLSFVPVNDSTQRDEIKTMLETHCHTPVTWLGNDQIEINIDPACRILKKRGIV